MAGQPHRRAPGCGARQRGGPRGASAGGQLGSTPNGGDPGAGAERRPNPKANANIKVCFDCHKPHEKQDFVITLAKLDGTFPPASAAKPASGATQVNIAGFVFGPGKINVAPGQAVTWTNTDDSPHQISVAGRKTGVMLRGQKAALSFDKEGFFDYVCSLHPTMKGQVEVRK